MVELRLSAIIFVYMKQVAMLNLGCTMQDLIFVILIRHFLLVKQIRMAYEES